MQSLKYLLRLRWTRKHAPSVVRASAFARATAFRWISRHTRRRCRVQRAAYSVGVYPNRAIDTKSILVHNREHLDRR